MASSELLPAVLARIDSDLDSSLERLFDFLRIPSISTEPAYRDQCLKAAQFVADDLAGIGFATSLRPTAGHPIVLGKAADSQNEGKTPHILFYGHYDVQPVDPLDQWDAPPFSPRIVMRPDGRKIIVARGACDDKGQVMTFIEACRAFKTVTGQLPLPITMMIEGEEECGSNHLFGFVQEHADELKLDLALVCDTSMWDASTPMVTTSLRGLVYEEVKITCADHDLHSGLFGEQDPQAIRAAFRAFVCERLPPDAKVEFNSFANAPAMALSFDHPALAKTRTALAAEWGKKAVTVGEGGSIPIIADFKRILGMDTIL